MYQLKYDGKTDCQDDWPERLGQRLAHHWEIVMAEPRFIAVVPFLWSFDASTDTPGIGMNRFGETWDDRTDGAGSRFLGQLIELGLQVKDGELRYPNLAWHETEAHPARQETPETGSILDVTSDGLVTAQAVDPALPHKNLRIQLNLRDTAGRLLLQSPAARTNQPVPIAVQDLPEDGMLLGTHGFEWQIPPPLLSAHAGRTLEVELLTFSDGPEPLLAHRATRRFEALPQPGWSIRYDGVLFHPDLWNLTHDRPGPVFRAQGHGAPARR